MTFPPQTIAVVGKYFAAGISESLGEIVAFLRERGLRVVIESETASNLALHRCESLTLDEIGQQADAVVVVGGDGTMLGVARMLAPYGVPLIGINQGRLGFITDIPLDRTLPALAEMLGGSVATEHRSLLQSSVLRDGQVIYEALAVNDVVLSRGGTSGMAELMVEVDGNFMYNQRSDGLIVATPTGSSAYALSAGGPILQPTLQGVVLVPIAPHALSNRPIVLPDTSDIVITVVNGRDISVNFDMQSLASLQHGDKIRVSLSKHRATFLHPLGWSYYETLRQKLHWNEYPSITGDLH